jgi:hypothetical protein
MTVTDIFHDTHLPVDKTIFVTARRLAVVCVPDMSKKKFQKPTIYFFFA